MSPKYLISGGFVPPQIFYFWGDLSPLDYMMISLPKMHVSCYVLLQLLTANRKINKIIDIPRKNHSRINHVACVSVETGLLTN